MFSLSSNLANCNNREPEPQAGSYTLRTSAFPMVTMRAKRLLTSCGVKNSPPDFPALLAYMVIRNS